MAETSLDGVNEIERCFTYQVPDDIQKREFEQLHDALVDLGQELLMRCPRSGDRDKAFEALRECRMWANSAIAHKGRY